MAQFNLECDGLTGPIAFELVCKRASFYGGVPAFGGINEQSEED